MYKDFVSTILKEKSTLTGIAILLIILCHLGVVDSDLFQHYPPLKVFSPGFIGVDVFLLFSGFSLGFSLENRGLKDFYIKRFKRIYPMFFIFAILSTLVYILKGDTVSLFDWLCNITTLSYYHVGGKPIDWYLSVLFIFYLLYPLIFVFVKKCKMGGVILTLISIFILTSFVDFYEYYGCAISRIPIFVFGIYLFTVKDSVKLTRNYLVTTLLFLSITVAAVFLLKKGYRIHGYFLVDTVAPALLLVLNMIVVGYRKLSFASYIDSFLSFFGKYSLEIYISNYLSMNIIGLFKDYDMYTTALFYIALNFVGSLLLIYTNKGIMKVVK